METTTTKNKAQEIHNGINEIHSMMKELTDTKLIFMGNEYKLSEWITISDYSKKYNVKTDLILKWIDRGVIPAGSAIVIPELNYLKLIKNQTYSARPYETRATL